mmetsp:Transcript_13911/g.20532  ORF Transcript_13911/g.20532 Transcript_13911/m.20532 type:complete len:530 (-) Transcript_13911:88-1677(-)|eukprot:CAMPEP_0194214108 /NCGR_PEP_ID=MMETSP0156-20130528/15178_1 /TAXON_ID=33649 /ORGANISM="Thalassionema nitzschioides, Strain L26-B" /LENGTH=529 /DNA_ID=CAMNT_0038942299 /DNA_START=65 /DNA_END=1654 /DNA_ORIENTATION=+
MKLLLGFCTTILATSHVLSFAATTKISSPIARAVRTRATASTCTELKMSGSSSLVLSIPRAGGQLSNILTTATASPSTLFDFTLLALAASAFGLKIIGTGSKSNSLQEEEKPVEVKSLQIKFLAAFWLLRCGYWMSGPYVVPAYKSKVFGGVEASMALVSKIFLSGFAATAIFGPSIGQATDRYGRKAGTIAFALLYSIGIASIKSNALLVLFAGRIVVGCALSLLFTAPEAWVNGEAGRQNLQKYLGETFGLAFTGDALVAIIAGKLASLAASVRGITGPFELGIVFLLAGATVSMLFWNENKADTSSTKNGNANKSGIREAFDIIRGDQKLMLVGAVQSLFEAAMNVFILQWPPIIAGAIKAVFGDGAVTPFGTIFSCFMTCSLLGSLTFGKIIKKKNALTESTAFSMLMVSALSMGLGAYFTAGATTSLTGIMIALFLYELTVGMYFPIIGTLRSKYVPDNNKSVILSLFGIPLNSLVLLAYLFIERLGTSGALGVSSAALAMAAGCMAKLKSIAKAESDQEGYNS